MKMKKFTTPAKIFLAILTFALFLCMVGVVRVAMADRISHESSAVTINHYTNSSKRLSGSLKGVASGLACSNISFIPSKDLQAGAALGSFSGNTGLCFGGAFTTSRDGALVSGRISKEDDETGFAVGASWRFK